MNVVIKTPEQIAKMREAGKLAAEVLEMIGEHVKPGVTTEELDRICHDHIVNKQHAIPACLGYRGFPKSICTSVNHVVCHGIPNDRKALKSGDIINIDVTVIKDGWHGDTSKMFFVGEPSVLARRLVDTTRECMMAGIRMVKPGVRLGDIGHRIQKMAEGERFSVVREYCGHGIGEGRDLLLRAREHCGPFIRVMRKPDPQPVLRCPFGRHAQRHEPVLPLGRVRRRSQRLRRRNPRRAWP